MDAPTLSGGEGVRLPAPPEPAARSAAAHAAPADLAPMPDEPPLDNRNFRVFLAGEGISALGDAIILGAVQMLPDLFIGMLAGVVADRADRRRMMLPPCLAALPSRSLRAAVLNPGGEERLTGAGPAPSRVRRHRPRDRGTTAVRPQRRGPAPGRRARPGR